MKKPFSKKIGNNIYKKGYGGGALGNIFNKYKLRFQFLKNNEVAGEFQI